MFVLWAGELSFLLKHSLKSSCSVEELESEMHREKTREGKKREENKKQREME